MQRKLLQFHTIVLLRKVTHFFEKMRAPFLCTFRRSDIVLKKVCVAAMELPFLCVASAAHFYIEKEKKAMKKVVCVILLLTIAFAFCACSDSNVDKVKQLTKEKVIAYCKIAYPKYSDIGMEPDIKVIKKDGAYKSTGTTWLMWVSDMKIYAFVFDLDFSVTTDGEIVLTDIQVDFAGKA